MNVLMINCGAPVGDVMPSSSGKHHIKVGVMSHERLTSNKESFMTLKAV